MPLISIIVIGLNEEKNLKECLSSIFESSLGGDEKLEIVYVDSGSIDNSIAIAKSFYNVKVISLQDSPPSAAKGRNLGASITKGDYIQFVDGDSALDKNWIKMALQALELDQSKGVVFGAIEEVDNKNTIYSKVCRFDWYTPPGDYRLCGGNAMWRRDIFIKAGGFDSTLSAGEEPDLCYKVRQNGHRIVCLDAPMVKHDLDMNSFKEYWLRSIRSGYAYSVIAMRFMNMEEKLWLKETIRNFLDPLLWVIIILSGFSIGWLASLSLLFAFISYRIIRIIKNVQQRTTSLTDALLYGLHIQFSRLPLALGQIKGLTEVFLSRISRKKVSKI